MTTRLMNIIKSEDKRNDHEWEAHSLKGALQMLDDAVAYQKYWNEQMTDREKEWDNQSPVKFGMWIGLFTHTTLEVSMTVAKRLMKELWKNGEDKVKNSVEWGHYPDGRVYAKIEPTQYRLAFHVKTEMIGDHCYKDVHDKVDEFRDKLILQKREEEE